MMIVHFRSKQSLSHKHKKLDNFLKPCFSVRTRYNKDKIDLRMDSNDKKEEELIFGGDCWMEILLYDCSRRQF